MFWFLVVLPTILATIYYGFMASDIYISNSSFVIRQPEKDKMTSLGMFLQSAGLTSSKDEVYSVREYMLSRDALRILDKNLNLREHYSNKNVDFIQRFDSLGLNNSFELFYEFYKNMVTIDINSAAGICTIKVKAFTPQDAHAIAASLLFLGECFINEINTRARQDLIRISLQEVEKAELAAKDAALALSTYRNRQSVFDPKQQSTMQLEQIAKLQSSLTSVRAQLAQYRLVAAKTPYIIALEKQEHELQKDISQTMGKVAGKQDSMTQQLIEFDRLTLDVNFADKRLTTALTALEQAKSEAQRQNLYLEQIAKPNVPDIALYPERFKDVLVVFFIGLLIYSTAYIFLIGVKEHQS